MSSLQIFQQQDFTGGLNFRADQFQLADNESPEMLNVEIDPRGGVFSRGGYQRINTTAVSGTWSPKRLHAFYGATPRLMLTTGAKVYRSTGGDFSTLEYAASTDIAVTSTNGASFANWGDELYIAVGHSSAGSYRWKTTDTYATAIPVLTSPNFNNNYNSPGSNHFPKAELLIVHANKMFAANIDINGTQYPNRIHWSHEDQPRDWAAADYIEINAGGTGITGLAVVAGSLVIFKPSATFVLVGYDSSNFQLVQLSTHLGAVHPRAVVQSDIGVYFYSNPEGLFFYNGSNIVDIFGSIRPSLDRGTFNTAAPNSVTLSYINHRLWMSAPYDAYSTVTDPKVNFVYDPSIGQFGSFTMFQSSDSYGLIGGCDYTNASDENKYMMIHPTQARVLEVDKYNLSTDNITGTQTGFTSSYRTKWFDGGTYMQKKMFRRPDIVVREPDVATTINVKVYHDFNDGANNERRDYDITYVPPAGGLVWGVGSWGENWSSGTPSSTVITGKNLGLARSVQLKFTGPSGILWGVNSIGYKFQPRRVKG
jgi:hypothetical protein